jgi:hypothetical protein
MKNTIAICLTILMFFPGKTEVFGQNLTYMSQQDGIKIKYPADLTIKDVSNTQTIFKAVKKNEYNFVVYTVNTNELDPKTAKVNEQNYMEMVNSVEKAYNVKTSKHKFKRQGNIRIISFENVDTWGNLNITYFYIYPSSLYTVVFNCDSKYFDKHNNEIFDCLNSFQHY